MLKSEVITNPEFRVTADDPTGADSPIHAVKKFGDHYEMLFIQPDDPEAMTTVLVFNSAQAQNIIDAATRLRDFLREGEASARAKVG